MTDLQYQQATEYKISFDYFFRAFNNIIINNHMQNINKSVS